MIKAKAGLNGWPSALAALDHITLVPPKTLAAALSARHAPATFPKNYLTHLAVAFGKCIGSN